MLGIKLRQRVSVRTVLGMAFVMLGTMSGCEETEKACAGSVPATVAAFVSPAFPVRCMDAANFDLEGRAVRLSHVEYGALVDCASGCFSSHVCAIEDPALGAPELFVAIWSVPEERPSAVAVDCPDISDDVMQTMPTCVPPGLRHPLVATTDFRDWAARESRSDGPLRWCVNFYGFAGNWP